MATLISRHQIGHGVRFYHRFESLVSPGSGYHFDCTEDGRTLSDDYKGFRGTVDLDTMTLTNTQDGDVIAQSWTDATQSGDYAYEGIVKHEWEFPIYAVYRCDCGRKIEMYSSWENVCDCGRTYNGSGQQIMSRDPNCHCGAYYSGRDCMCHENDYY